jgi:hypothetical protein
MTESAVRCAGGQAPSLAMMADGGDGSKRGERGGQRPTLPVDSGDARCLE